MRILLLSYLLFASSGLYSQQKHSSKATNDIAILYERNGSEKVVLTKEEMRVVDSVFRIALADHNKHVDASKTPYLILKPENYNRQYLPFIQNGEIKVYVNCFCGKTKDYPYWKKQQVIVYDGGSCFFNLVINVETKHYSELNINGSA